MNLSGLEQHVFAYYVANAAEQLNMVPRYWPYGELKLLVEDKVQVAVRKFGLQAGDRAFVWGLLSQPSRGERTSSVT